MKYRCGLDGNMEKLDWILTSGKGCPGSCQDILCCLIGWFVVPVDHWQKEDVFLER